MCVIDWFFIIQAQFYSWVINGRQSWALHKFFKCLWRSGFRCPCGQVIQFPWNSVLLPPSIKWQYCFTYIPGLRWELNGTKCTEICRSMPGIELGRCWWMFLKVVSRSSHDECNVTIPPAARGHWGNRISCCWSLSPSEACPCKHRATGRVELQKC